MAVLIGLLEAGFTELDTLRTEGKLECLRHSAEFDELLEGMERDDTSGAGAPAGRKHRNSADQDRCLSIW
jgi:hypothetical protein